MEIPVYTLDAFTCIPFKGNPAAVCPLQHELTEEMYQKISAEMNLSETAFIIKLNPSDNFTTGSRFRLRWFTPTTEVNLCGHATLATARVLFQYENNVNNKLVFETRSGELCVTRYGDNCVMDFPLYKASPADPNEFRDTIKAAVGSLPVQEVYLCAKTKKLLIRLADRCDRSELCNIKIDPIALQRSDSTGKVKGVIVTMIGSPNEQPGYDFYSRYFAPWFGITEDPVTGSAHTVLGSYWAEKLGKRKLLAYQCSSRGGEMELEVRDDGRINITGTTVTVMRGTITI
ncbi:phenazine biosynthesis-like domain-containing protein 1 [Periophthalmus magnuspinnatus]|uniref:phenazine biosynthesis-like domain-containing protein 1 n=1 Tax=Periophthalmus magnuspinnatus TaxID=409849 RepID=UPI00145BBFD4|nr:phenazine biosynthesis-like domain-containing protein 1 [Periophthalmus magnuspinnatus]XP_055087784.1 phenazine biosynthesis-like domain-containing protein 1 [Periophthalmus magnuspinnatus]